MNRIAILTEQFMLWSGGVDFIKNIILSLTAVAKENNLEIFVFISNDKVYKNYKGLKRLFKRIQAKYFIDSKVEYSHPMFPEIEGCKFIKYTSLNLNKILKKFNIDFFFPHLNTSYLNIPIPQLGYLYDCQHKYYPEFFAESEIKARDEIFKKMVESNVKIIVNAYSVKNDLIKFFNANTANIFVLPFSPKIKKEYLENNSDLITKYNLPMKYFIISNQFWLHKDHITAFKAFAELIKNPEYKDIGLICTGLMEDLRRPEYIEELKQLIFDLGCKDKIQCLGLIPKIEQIEIMKGALAVVQPTLFEGGPGGGSVWDAISLNVPVILSDITTNRKIKENNVFFFEARNVSDLTSKMKDILTKKFERASKNELIKKSQRNNMFLGNFLVNVIKKEII